MEITLKRFFADDNTTIGVLSDENGNFLNFILEDQYQDEKVYGETRIPAGRYEIKLRKAGRIHAKYVNRFPEFHEGMLWLQDIPNFTYIYIHTGTTDKDTLGCLLTGNGIVKHKDKLQITYGTSTQAYIPLYKKLSKAILEGEKVYINIIDADR